MEEVSKMPAPMSAKELISSCNDITIRGMAILNDISTTIMNDDILKDKNEHEPNCMLDALTILNDNMMYIVENLEKVSVHLGANK